MNLDDILRKIESFSHPELNRPEYKNRIFLQTAINSGWDIFRRNIEVEVKPFDDASHGYPEVFRKYHEKLMRGEGM
jgi:hypothetical protein